MNFPLAEITERIPLHADDQGVIRIGASRVTLETLIEIYKVSASLEEVARQFPSLPFQDILYVVGYYLNHTVEIEAYLVESAEKGERVRENIEAHPSQILRTTLLARLGR
jgi:uncharacterized protein (DUF433 family)